MNKVHLSPLLDFPQPDLTAKSLPSITSSTFRHWFKTSLTNVAMGNMGPVRLSTDDSSRTWKFTFYPNNGHCTVSYRDERAKAFGGCGYSSLQALYKSLAGIDAQSLEDFLL